MFNPDTFLDFTVTEANSTKLTPIPVGEYTAIAKSVKVRTWTGKADPSQSGVILDVIWDLDSEPLREELGRREVTCKQSVMLDVSADGSGLDMGKGKNVGLGRLREAINLNTPGKPFSFNQIPGSMALVRVEQRIDGENIYSEVKGVARI